MDLTLYGSLDEALRRKENLGRNSHGHVDDPSRRARGRRRGQRPPDGPGDGAALPRPGDHWGVGLPAHPSQPVRAGRRRRDPRQPGGRSRDGAPRDRPRDGGRGDAGSGRAVVLPTLPLGGRVRCRCHRGPRPRQRRRHPGQRRLSGDCAGRRSRTRRRSRGRADALPHERQPVGCGSAVLRSVADPDGLVRARGGLDAPRPRLGADRGRCGLSPQRVRPLPLPRRGDPHRPGRDPGHRR